MLKALRYGSVFFLVLVICTANPVGGALDSCYDESVFKDSMIKGAAYFKHFKSRKNSKRLGSDPWRDVIVIYDCDGNTLKSIETTGCIDIDRLYGHVVKELLEIRRVVVPAYYKKAGLSRLGYAKSGDFLGIDKYDEKNYYPSVTDTELSGLVYEINTVAYCSAYSDDTNYAIKVIRARAAQILHDRKTIKAESK